jgi:GT2 family glycosyltransferase
MIISIIVASHRPEYIADCAASLCSQELPPDCSLDAVVVADYPVDALAARFTGIRWLYHADRSIPAKRNRGIATARGSIIGFIDDDCRAHPAWAASAAAYLAQHPRASGVEGKTDIAISGQVDGKAAQFKRLERPGFRTNNIAYRSAAIASVNGFDERFFEQREDMDLAFSVLAGGGAIDICESMQVVHAMRPGEPWDLLKNCVNRRFDPLLHKKHRRLYRRHIRTPWTPMIALMGATHILLAAALVCAPAWGIPATAVDAAVALALALRRNAGGRPRTARVAADALAYLLSPPALLGALVLGSIRCRTILIA